MNKPNKQKSVDDKGAHIDCNKEGTYKRTVTLWVTLWARKLTLTAVAVVVLAYNMTASNSQAGGAWHLTLTVIADFVLVYNITADNSQAGGNIRLELTKSG